MFRAFSSGLAFNLVLYQYTAVSESNSAASPQLYALVIVYKPRRLYIDQRAVWGGPD